MISIYHPRLGGLQVSSATAALQEKVRGCFFRAVIGATLLAWGTELEVEMNQPGVSHQLCTVTWSTSHLFGPYPASRIMETVDAKQWLCIFCRAGTTLFPPQNVQRECKQSCLGSCRGSSKWRCSVQTLRSPMRCKPKPVPAILCNNIESLLATSPIRLLWV